MNLILGLGFCSPSSSPGPGYTNFFFLMPSCCSVTKCNPMDWSTPSFPVLHHLLELAQTPLSQWYHPTILSSVVPLSSYPQSFPTSGSFPMSWLFASGGQSIGASASASVLAMDIQGWLPLGLTGLISFQSKGLSRVFSSTTVESINSSALSLLYQFIIIIV